MEEEIYLFTKYDEAIFFKNTNGHMENTRQTRSKMELLNQVSFGVESFAYDEARRNIFLSNQEKYEQYQFVSRMKKKTISFLFPETLFNENESYRQALQRFLRKVHEQKMDVPKRKVIKILFYSILASPLLLREIRLVRKKGLRVKEDVFCKEPYQKR